MKLFIVEYWQEIIPIIISITALIYSIKAWQRNRTIYGLERMVLRQSTGRFEDIFQNEDKINEKLSNGGYTVLSVLERTKSDNDWELLLGRITPYQNKKQKSSRDR